MLHNAVTCFPQLLCYLCGANFACRCRKPMRMDMAVRSVTFTSHWGVWDSFPGWAVPSHHQLCSSGTQPPDKGQVQLPASRTKMSKDHLWRWQAPKHPLPQCFWWHTIICWGFKILIPDGAFLALEERLKKRHAVFIHMPDQAIANSNLETTPYCNTCLYTMNRVKEKFMAELLKKKKKSVFSPATLTCVVGLNI